MEKLTNFLSKLWKAWKLQCNVTPAVEVFLWGYLGLAVATWRFVLSFIWLDPIKTVGPWGWYNIWILPGGNSSFLFLFCWLIIAAALMLFGIVKAAKVEDAQKEANQIASAKFLFWSGYWLWIVMCLSPWQ